MPFPGNHCVYSEMDAHSSEVVQKTQFLAPREIILHLWGRDLRVGRRKAFRCVCNSTCEEFVDGRDEVADVTLDDGLVC